MNDIKEARVFAEADSFMGESVVAEVVLYDKKTSLHDIHLFCKRYMSEYKIPKRIYIVDDIKKTSTNKIKRN